VRDEIETLLGQFRLATPPGQGASQHLPDRNAQVRNDVRPVVDVLLQRATLARGTFPHQSDRVDIEHERRRAPLVRGLRVEDMRLAERRPERLNLGRMLMQEVAEVGEASDS